MCFNKAIWSQFEIFQKMGSTSSVLVRIFRKGQSSCLSENLRLVPCVFCSFCVRSFLFFFSLFQKIIGRRERVNFFFDISKVLITIIWLKIKIFILNDKSGLCFERLKVKNNLKHLWFSLLKLIPFSLLKFTNGKGQGIDVAKLLKM